MTERVSAFFSTLLCRLAQVGERAVASPFGLTSAFPYFSVLCFFVFEGFLAGTEAAEATLPFSCCGHL